MSQLLLTVVALAIAHALLGFGAAICIETGWNGPPAQVVFDAVYFADAGLLGVWAALGRHSKAIGFVGAGLGLVYLGTLAAIGLRPSLDGRIHYSDDLYVVAWVWLLFLSLALVTIAVVLAVSLALGNRDIRLARSVTGAAAETALDRPQFSLLQLMLLVFAVALVIQLGPLAQGHLNDYSSSISSLVAVTTGGLSFGGVTVIACWAALATRWPSVAALVAVSLAAVIGLVPPYYFPQFLTDDFVATSATTVLESVLVAGSLLAFRSLGYRLVRVAKA
jgi:hypothetical protein